MFKSKNTELKFQITALWTIVIPHQRNHKCQYFTYLRKFPGENTVWHLLILGWIVILQAGYNIIIIIIFFFWLIACVVALPNQPQSD